MSKVLIVYCHPDPKSFSHAIRLRLEAELQVLGAEVRTRDLYQQKFDAVLDGEDFATFQAGKVPADIQAEQAEVRWANRLAFIYPLWWFDRPALLKGYFDRVYSYGFAFQSSSRGLEGLLTQPKALVCMTTGSPEVELNQISTSIPSAMSEGTLRFCGVQHVVWKSFFNVVKVSDGERKAMLEEIPALAKTLLG